MVVALAAEGLLASLYSVMSSLPLAERPNWGDNAGMSSFESLKKLPHTLAAMVAPLDPETHGGVGEVAVGGFRDMDGIRFPEVSRTANCFR